MGSFLCHVQCSANACGLLWLPDMNKTKPVPSSFTHTSLEMEGVGAGFATWLRGSACSYLHPSTVPPESWEALVRRPGLGFIPPRVISEVCLGFSQGCCFSWGAAEEPDSAHGEQQPICNTHHRQRPGREGAGVTRGASLAVPTAPCEQQESRGGTHGLCWTPLTGLAAWRWVCFNAASPPLL